MIVGLNQGSRSRHKKSVIEGVVVVLIDEDAPPYITRFGFEPPPSMRDLRNNDLILPSLQWNKDLINELFDDQWAAKICVMPICPSVTEDYIYFTNSSTGLMAANGSQNGIQLLLAAEQEAQHIVNAAKNAKMARLRQAKEEAERDIADFRAQMEADFQRRLAESSGDSGANVKRLEQETDAKIEQLKSQASNISPQIVQMLLKYVTTVNN
ncbi:hypothetical protein KSS87_007497 [Heliosperma pusillum]|nr:hypothetical protein KSS87_007497 [Heliosperma pusillum]